jgi:hypothetical protein
MKTTITSVEIPSVNPVKKFIAIIKILTIAQNMESLTKSKVFFKLITNLF